MRVNLRLAGIEYHSKISAPSISTTLFTQGCNRRCDGCFNPETWDLNGGELYDIDLLAKYLDMYVPYRWLSISGGEPMLQAEALTKFLDLLKDTSGKWTILCYTGYVIEDLLLSKEHTDLLSKIDILVDGPFIQSLRLPIGEFQFVGSSNQRVINVQDTLRNGSVALY